MNNLISTPTRRAQNSETLLDPVAVSDSVGVLKVGTLDVCNTISDHLATYIHSAFTYSLGFSYTRTVCSYKSGDYDKLNDLIRTKNWDFLTEEDIDTVCANFTSTLMHFIKQCVPNKEDTNLGMTVLSGRTHVNVIVSKGKLLNLEVSQTGSLLRDYETK